MADSPITSSPEIVTRKDAKADGLKRYFTGKPCKHGHVDYRYVVDYACFECARQKTARMRRENPGIQKRASSARKARYHSDPEFRAKRIAETADWVRRNKERSREYFRERYEANKDKLLAQSKKLRSRKKLDPEWLEKERARKRAQHRRNPETKRSHVRKRRAMIRGAEGSHNAKDISLLLKRQKHRCPYCDANLKSDYEVDHVMPLAKGGSNWPSNLQCLCPPCNRSKWCKDPIDFAQEKGRLL